MLDYTTALDAVGEWIAAGAGLVAGETLVAEPALPKAPDACAAFYEAGGTEDEARGEFRLRVGLLARASTLAEARKLLFDCINAAQAGFLTAEQPRGGGISALTVAGLPSNEGRDENSRVVMSAALELLCNSYE